MTNPTSYRLPLWKLEHRVDWCKITDFELFCNLYSAAEPEITALILPGVDLTTYEKKFRVLGEEEYELVLHSEQEDRVIDNMTYLEISQYLRTLFNIFPKDEYGKGKATREAMIWEDEEKAKKEKVEGFKSSLFPLVSACTNHPGFKYKVSELKELGIFEFMDSVQRL